MAEKHLQDMSAETLVRKQLFLKLACQNLVRNGGIATVLADYTRRLLAFLKVNAEFTYVTGCLTICMKEEISPGHGVQNLIIKTGLGYNFDKLEDVEAVLVDLMEGRLAGGLDEATKALEKIQKRPNLYGAWVHPLSWSIIGGLATMMLEGKLIDMAVATGTGLVFGTALVACDYYPPMGFTFEFWISYLVAAILGFVQVAYKDFTFWPAFLSSVILILPGFSMAMGFMDVFARQTVVGLTTLFNAAWMALMIGLGAFMGIASVSTVVNRPIVPHFPGEYSGGPPTFHISLQFVAYVIFNFFLNLSFQAKLREAFLIVPMATASFGVFMVLGMAGVGTEANIMLSCLFMGIVAQIYGKVLKRSEIPAIYSGVIVFAPGTNGARSTFYSLKAMYEVVNGDTVFDLKSVIYSVKQAGGMLTICGSMALGLLLSRALFGRL